MIFLSPDSTSQVANNSGFSFDADTANAAIALGAFILSLVIFVRQSRLDRKDKKEAIESAAKAELEAERLRERNIAFQWYKDFAITPNIQHLHAFYQSLYDLQKVLKPAKLTDAQKKAIINLVDDASESVFNTLISAIRPLNTKLADDVGKQIDDLGDYAVQTITSDTYKLSLKPTFDQVIGEQIEKSKHDTFALLYRYKGN